LGCDAFDTRHSEVKTLSTSDLVLVVYFSLEPHNFPRGVIPMKKVLYSICVLFVAVAFGSVALADHHEKKTAPMDNTMKMAPTDNAAKTPVKK